MRILFKIAFHSFVKTFYRENAGLFVFLFTVMFCIVSKVDGAGVFEYHYSLILGMLKSNLFLLLVFFAWFLYTRKFVAFAIAIIKKPEYAFLHVFNSLERRKRIKLFLFVSVCLLLPVIVYGICIVITGWKESLYMPAIFVSFYLAVLCFLPAFMFTNTLEGLADPVRNILPWPIKNISYPLILLQFVARHQKMIWLGTKIFTCGILYLVARNNTIADYDTSFAFLFFNFGVLANAIIIFRIRSFEQTFLGFYPALPIPLLKRFGQYAVLYFLLLLPEFITIVLLMPVHLHSTDALCFILASYSLVLLMNSITFLQDLSMKQFLKILVLVFCVQFVFILTAGTGVLALLFFVLAVLCFTTGYYRFEKIVTG